MSDFHPEKLGTRQPGSRTDQECAQASVNRGPRLLCLFSSYCYCQTGDTGSRKPQPFGQHGASQSFLFLSEETRILPNFKGWWRGGIVWGLGTSPAAVLHGCRLWTASNTPHTHTPLLSSVPSSPLSRRPNSQILLMSLAEDSL